METNRWMLSGALAATLALTPLTTSRAQQEPPAGDPPAGRRGGGGPGGGGFLRGRGNQPLTLATVPVAALAGPLNLSTEQKTQIGQIQEKLQSTRRGGGGRGGPGATGQPGGAAPDFQAMMQARQQAEQTATTQMEALLTPQQKQALPAVLKDMQTLAAAGLPVQLMSTLNLSAEQKTKLADIGAKAQQALQRAFQGAQGGAGNDPQAMRETMQQARAQTQQQVSAVLTDAQRAQVEAYRKENPERGGGPGGGGRGGNGPAGAGAPPGGI